MNRLTEQQQELARVRRIKPPRVVDPDKPQRQTDPFKYERAEIFIRDGVKLDPRRAVLPKWKSTVYDGLTRAVFEVKEAGQTIDLGDGGGVSVDEGGPFRVRVLASFLDNPGSGPVRRLDVGEVIEVSATKYCLIRSAEVAVGHGTEGRRRFEPVPDTEPLRGPLLPPNFPSSLPKAKAQAAKGLKKSEHELSFAEIVKFFEKHKNGAQVFAG